MTLRKEIEQYLEDNRICIKEADGICQLFVERLEKICNRKTTSSALNIQPWEDIYQLLKELKATESNTTGNQSVKTMQKGDNLS